MCTKQWVFIRCVELRSSVCEGRLLSRSVQRVTEMLFRRYEGVGIKLSLKWYHGNAVFAIDLLHCSYSEGPLERSCRAANS